MTRFKNKKYNYTANVDISERRQISDLIIFKNSSLGNRSSEFDENKPERLSTISSFCNNDAPFSR